MVVVTTYALRMEAAQAVADRLRQIVAGIVLAHEKGSAKEVRTGALQLLATLGSLRGSTPEDMHLRSAWRSDMSSDARAALWLIDVSAHSILDDLDANGPSDWVGVGAASSFAQSGVQQLEESVSGSV